MQNRRQMFRYEAMRSTPKGYRVNRRIALVAMADVADGHGCFEATDGYGLNADRDGFKRREYENTQDYFSRIDL